MAHDYNKYQELTNSQLQTEGFSSPHVQITEDFEAEVVKVTDGDTITLKTTFRDFKFPLRFLDTDAPEMNEGGDVAKQWLKSRIENTTVQIIINRKNRVGKYGRLLGKVVSRGIEMGEAMLRLGLVKTFGKKDEGKIPKEDKIFRLRQWF